MATSKRKQVTKFQEGVNDNFRDAYSNNESDLQYDGVDQYLVAPLKTLSGDFSISFFDERPVININKMIFSVGDDNADFLRLSTGQSGAVHPYEAVIISGGVTIDARNNVAKDTNSENQDWINRKTHAFYNFDQSNTKIDCYINGELQWTKTDANFTGLSIDGLLRISTWHVVADFFQGKLSHICVFNRLGTEQEILGIWSEIGIVPPSIHANIVTHYPLTERFSFKATAAFIVKNTQFNVGDNVFFDIVEQYNYAKGSPLAANHIEAIAYTDAELGTGGNSSSQIVKNDFYNKTVVNKVGMKLNQDGTLNERGNIPNNAIFDFGTDNFLLEFDLIREQVSVGTFLFIKRNGGHLIAIFLTTSGFLEAQLVDVNSDENKIQSTLPFNINDNGSLFTLKFIKEGTTENDWFFEVNGLKLSQSVIQTFGAGWQNLSLTTNGDIFIMNHNSSNLGLKDLLIRFRVNINSIDKEVFFFSEFQGSTAKGVINSSILTIQNQSASRQDIGGGAWIEKESLISEIKQAIFHETGISISASYTSIVGMGFTIQLLADISLLSEIITGLPSITKFVFNGIEVSNEAALITALNLNELCHVDLEWASASRTITFLHTGEDYQLIRDYYLHENLSQLERKRLTNNILFANPSLQLQEKFNYYALHNEGNYVAGATNPENVPLIDVDAIGNRESLGWTGGDAATKLADLVTNINLINDLR